MTRLAPQPSRVVLLHEKGRHKPIGFEPPSLRLKGLASAMERPESWTADGRQVGKPLSGFIGLDVGPANNRHATQGGKVDFLAVETADRPDIVNDQLHAVPSLLWPPEDVPTRTIHQEAIQHRLDPGQLSRHVAPQAGVLPQVLRLDSTDHPLGVVDQAVQLLVGSDVQLPEASEEFSQIFDC